MTYKTSFAACAGLLILMTPALAQVGGGDIPAQASAKAGRNADGQKMGGMNSSGMMSGGMMRSKHHNKTMMMNRSSGKMQGHKTF